MAFPQAAMTYGNLDPELILAGSFVFSRGVSPSVAVLRALPTPDLVDAIGTLTLTFNGATISFPGCKLLADGARRSMFRERGGRWSMEYLIADRRWAWKHRRVDGLFNQRLPDCRLLEVPELPLRKRSARQLAALLLDALGETGYDVSHLPDTAWPRLELRDNSIGGQLESLAETFGCVVVLGIDNVVRILRRGQGDTLPLGDTTFFDSVSWKSAGPAAVKLRARPTRVQAKLKLEPVAVEEDGSVVAVDDASYAPAAGWESQWPDAFAGVAEADRHLAFRSVWRWFRVIGAEDGSLDIPDVPFTLGSITQILPLEKTLLDTAEQRDGVLGSVPCYLEGAIYQQGDLPEVAPSRRLNIDFEIDAENGLVKLPYPVHSLGTDGRPAAPELYLTTSFCVRQASGEHWMAAATAAVPGGAGPTIEASCPHLWSVVGCATNTASAVDAELQVYAQSLAASLAPADCDDMAYDGLVAIQIDGAIAQVHWHMPFGSPAYTRAGRNVEIDSFTPAAAQRRDRERVLQLWEESR
jgi:hypothetical protein